MSAVAVLVGAVVHLDLRGVFDDVVVGEDEAVLAVDDESRAGRACNLIALAPPPVRCLVVVSLTLALTLPSARSAEEAPEEVVGSAAAAEQPFEIL